MGEIDFLKFEVAILSYDPKNKESNRTPFFLAPFLSPAPTASRFTGSADRREALTAVC